MSHSLDLPASPGPRIALGIDPGTAIVGYAVVMARGSELSMLVCDVITTSAKLPLAQRLQLIYEGLSKVIAIYKPQEAAMEALFFAKNARTAMAVGHARGVAMLALANGGLSVAEYTPKQVKLAVTGYGGAGKDQVGEMVRILLKLTSVPRPDDAADAAAVAICHLHTIPTFKPFTMWVTIQDKEIPREELLSKIYGSLTQIGSRVTHPYQQALQLIEEEWFGAMITGIHGTLEACRADQAIIRVGGFSIRVFAPSSTLHRLNEPGMEVSLYTHFVVREDGMTLYGFSTEEDRDAFEQLLAVNGVGPKVALALLSIMDAAAFYQAIADEDQQRLGLAQGVGKKLAARLVLELKGKLPSLAHLGSSTAAAPSGKVQAEVLEALIGLGFSNAEAQAALAKIPQDQAMTLEQQVTYALRTFSRK